MKWYEVVLAAFAGSFFGVAVPLLAIIYSFKGKVAEMFAPPPPDQMAAQMGGFMDALMHPKVPE